ncbi:hypothetical protein WN51_01292 [Melipona quadrifasciata]|uniref:Uncharacterized protein n=1 Tax=Melipona quadrifasciata TaxID=166423 RepID=A0A0M9A0U8_9HYME|nr:hypothetical protein WN51_01292 [Melipona quadrifasciata]
MFCTDLRVSRSMRKLRGHTGQKTRCTYDETRIPQTRKLTLSSLSRCVSDSVQQSTSLRSIKLEQSLKFFDTVTATKVLKVSLKPRGIRKFLAYSYAKYK